LFYKYFPHVFKYEYVIYRETLFDDVLTVIFKLIFIGYVHHTRKTFYALQFGK